MPVKMNNSFVTHRVNLFEPDLLFCINCLAFNPDENKLAVLRRSLPRDVKSQTSSNKLSQPTTSPSELNDDSLKSHSLIEIWDWTQDHQASLIQVIHEDEDDPSSLESLGWSFDGRLWTCGLNGRLHQVDLVNNLLNQGYPLISGAGWCLQFNDDKTLVAVGTEEGYICVFNVATADQDKYGIDFVKTMNRDKARILCVSWFEEEGSKKIVSGSAGCIKIWDYENGTCLNVIRSSNEKTIFWCLLITDDFTIISGDSKGNTSFWDGKNATLINSVESHKADVLCLTQSTSRKADSNKIFYSSGTDPSIITFIVDSSGKGIQSTKLHLHNNDVRSLVTCKDWLVSGGFDCYLSKTTAFPPKQIHQAPVFNNFIHIDKNRLLFQYSKSLQIWETGSTTKPTTPTTNSSETHNHNESIQSNSHNSFHDYRNDIISYGGSSSSIPLMVGPSQLITIQSKRLIHHSNFSGPWVCYSILEKVRILHYTENSVTKVPLLCDLNGETVIGIEFLDKDEDKYLLLSTGLKLYIFKLTIFSGQPGTVFVKEIKDKRRLLMMTSCSSYVALVMADCTVYLLSTTDPNWSKVHKFKLSSLPTYLSFNSYQKDLLWFTFSNHLVLSFSISSSEFTKYQFNEPSQHLPLIGITFHPDGFITYDQDRLYHYNGTSWTSSDRYSHLAKVKFMEEKQELLLIEVTPNMIKKKLPIRFTKKKFGT